MTPPRADSQRDELLAAYFAAEREVEELLEASDAPQGDRTSRLSALTQRVGHLREKYRALVPLLRISRCPLTGGVIQHSIDALGLDGLWWNHSDPVRPNENLPATFLALTGALQLWDPVETAPFICKPGAGAPYVLPRLLEDERVRAVVSSFPVGHHRAFAIVYTADPMTDDLARVNDWGSANYTFVDADGDLCRAAWEPGTEDADFDLEPWIRAGRLLWIAPDDPTLTLRSLATDCPYVDVAGERAFLRLYDGRVWTDALEPAR
jgi:hypothetical protein